jgi:Carboxypeptidase regulatory-like domain
MARRNAPNNALVVRTFSSPTTAVGSRPDDPDVRPLAGCTVTITQGPGPSLPTPQPLPSPQVTDATGEVRFENIPEGTSANPYRISVTQPTGFQAPPAPPARLLFVNGRGPFSFAHNLPVKEGGEVIAAVVLAPNAGRVTGTVQITMPPPAAPVTQAGIRVEARNGGLLVDSDQTDAAGAYQLAIDRPGLIEIIPQPDVQVGNLTFNPQPGDASQFVLVRAGDTSVQANITYVASGAQILVAAQLVEQVDGEERRSTLDNVTFRLFEQGKTDPLRELITQQQTSGAFSDLPAGAYRIEALPPAASNGQRLQLTRPSTPALSIRVGDGQHLDLTQEFEFQPTRGSVIGSVVVARDDRPVPGVAVVISSQQEPQFVRRVVTDADGAYGVDELPPGRYRVTLERTSVAAFGTSFELDGDRDPGRIVEVRPRATSVVDEFRLVEDEHLITGSVVRPDGTGAAFVTVQIFDDLGSSATLIGTVLTDQNGIYRFRAPRAGTFFVEVLAPGGFAPQRMPVSVNRPTNAPPLSLPTGPPVPGGGGSTGGTGTTSQPSSLQDLNDFPFLTEEVDLSGGLGPAPPAGAVGAVGQAVERTMREVLGWRPRASDPKGFQAALVRAFTATEVAGHTEYSWNPRSYAVEIQADLGAVTGAQASLYTRAKSAIDQALPLLEGLKPLRVDFDAENVNAIRGIVQTQLTELLAELGVEGGPRVQRVDQIFGFLLGDRPFIDLDVLRDPDQVEGTLGDLSERLGLERKRINTIEEEQNFTNFLVVVDHVVSLAESWDAQRKFFARESVADGVEPFLGTQLVLLSRDLEVVAESVREVEFAMNSVFLGPNERQTLELRFPQAAQTSSGQQAGAPTATGTPPMFVSELLSWVERFATDEGRKLIDEGGRLGVVAFRPTILLLEALVRAALVPPQDPNRMPAAYRRQRVQRALRELADQLKNAAARVELISPPADDGPDNQTPATPTTQPAVSQPRRRRRQRPPAPSNGQPQPPVIT